MDQVALRVRHLVLQDPDVRREVDLLDRPRVLDGGPVHLVEARVLHRAQRQPHPWVQEARSRGAHQHASQVSGFSMEHDTAPSTESGAMATVALAIFVAGLDRRKY